MPEIIYVKGLHMISKMFFKKVPFSRKKGIFTKKGFILDEIKKGFELKTNTIIFGDSEIRKKIFINNIYSSLLNKSDSSLSVLREDFGVSLAKELSSAGSDFRFINLSDDIKECGKVIEDFKKLSTFDSNNIVAVF